MKISVVGTGPGSYKHMTNKAVDVIRNADVIVGYKLYTELIKDLSIGKKVLTTGMRQEVDRCKIALEEAKKGKDVALVCSGDAGVYGLAGVMLEIAGGSGIIVDIVPGVTSATSCASVLGAPLIHDFAVISLSDLLTPWEKIVKRIHSASESDFVISFYNPRSKKRITQLNEAVQIITQYRSDETPCGYVKNMDRNNELSEICTLKSIVYKDIDMLTTIIVGNSQTKVVDGKLVTPRGYLF